MVEGYQAWILEKQALSKAPNLNFLQTANVAQVFNLK
jgi:hypothetical protein